MHEADTAENGWANIVQNGLTLTKKISILIAFVYVVFLFCWFLLYWLFRLYFIYLEGSRQMKPFSYDSYDLHLFEEITQPPTILQTLHLLPPLSSMYLNISKKQ